MSESNISAIAEALGRIMKEGGNGNLTVFLADEEKNYYIQFLGGPEDSSLWGEAVSNEFLDPAHSLSNKQMGKLTSLGWRDPESNGPPNFRRDWEASDDNDRLSVARDIHTTLVEVYGFPADRQLAIEINLA